VDVSRKQRSSSVRLREISVGPPFTTQGGEQYCWGMNARPHGPDNLDNGRGRSSKSKRRRREDDSPSMKDSELSKDFGSILSKRLNLQNRDSEDTE